MNPLYIMTAFIVKHFLCDFPLQVPYHYQNKGKYGHLGGIEHAACHACGTAVIITSFDMSFWAVLIDFALHYHIDWAKMNLNARMKWTPMNSEKFWYLLGFDQMLHYLTYVGIVLWA